MADKDDVTFTDVHLREDLTGDPLLGALARLAQEDELGMSVTVNVAGTIYSGVTVGRDRWFAMVADVAASSSASAGRIVGQFRDSYTATFQGPDAPEPHYGYLHMREVVTINGGQVVGPKALWRVQISEISAWTFGAFETS